jgi:hypothetical protein
MNPQTERFEQAFTWALSLLGVSLVFLRVPIPTASALITGGVAALVSRYATVGALTSAVILPLLIGIGAGRAGIALAASVLVTAATLWRCRKSIGRLRRGEERQIGGSLRAPFGETDVGLWASPAPHGVLGRSALPLGAILVIVVTIGLAVLVTVRLA